MKYINMPVHDHGGKALTGILITNLGTPDAPTAAALRNYLREFLSDPRVVEVPRLLWWFILHGFILRFRPRRSAAAYRKVWESEGSPLLRHTKDQATALQNALTAQLGDRFVVDFAMRYGQPSIDTTLQSLLERGVTKLLVLPLYPQYGAPTTASTFDAIASNFRRRRWLPELRFVTHYHDFPPYILALANKIRAHWSEHGRADKIVFSYHGVPQSFLDRGDPYHCECYKTSRLVAEALALQESEYTTSFQSRFGREEWLKPYTDEVLKALPSEGCCSVQILCPGFSADCLETLEEVDEENRTYFMNAGGERFEYIPCLNSDTEHIDALTQLITAQLSGWNTQDEDSTRTKALATSLGANN